MAASKPTRLSLIHIYTRDLLYDKATNKQFITIQTKNGNTFFIVIDYDAPINDCLLYTSLR